jgi:hypothetical protein
LAIAVGAASIVGAIAGYFSPEDSRPLPDTPDHAAAAGGVSPLVSSAFDTPAALANLPDVPGRMAVDTSGILWFVTFGTPTTLYSYDPETGELSVLELPDGDGTRLFSALRITPTGNILVADGYTITKVDPNSRAVSSTEFDLRPANFVQQTWEEGSWISDMVVGDDGTIYVTRMNMPVITVLNETLSVVREIPVPKEFGPVTAVEWAPSSLIISNGFGAPAIDSQVGQLWLDGAYTGLGISAERLIDGGPSGSIFGTGQGPGLKAAFGGEPAKEIVRLTDAILSEYVDNAVVSPDGSVLWASAAGAIYRIELSSGDFERYDLPAYDLPISAVTCPVEIQCESGVVATSVIAMAAGNSGEIFISSTPTNGIAVLKSGH